VHSGNEKSERNVCASSICANGSNDEVETIEVSGNLSSLNLNKVLMYP